MLIRQDLQAMLGVQPSVSKAEKDVHLLVSAVTRIHENTQVFWGGAGWVLGGSWWEGDFLPLLILLNCMNILSIHIFKYAD